jgi:hypothetical protein
MQSPRVPTNYQVSGEIQPRAAGSRCIIGFLDLRGRDKTGKTVKREISRR